MIPKTIHYCWFGDGEINKDFEKFLASWKKHQPDYEIIRWDESNFSFESAPEYVVNAYENKCYAIVSDYARAKVVYENGGWYLDTDVEVLQPFFDKYSDYNFVAAAELSLDGHNKVAEKEYYYNAIDEQKRRINGEDGFVSGVSILMSIFGAQKGCNFLKDVMEFYETLDYDRRDYKGCLFGGPIGPQIYARCMEKYGFVYDAIEQKLDDNILILDPKIMHNGSEKTDETCALHKCTFSWFINFLTHNPKASLRVSKDGKKETVKIRRGFLKKPKKFTLTHDDDE